MIKFKSIYRLIRRFIVFFILLLLMNILVIFIAGFSKANSASITSTLNLIAEQTDISQAKVELEDNAQKTIEQNDLWMMVLDENGNQIFDFNLPRGFATHYSLTDVARFSRFYLNDYPVFTQIKENFLIVVGFPKDKVFKFPANYYERSDLEFARSTILALAILNCLFFVGAYAYSTRLVIKKFTPITEAINSLPKGLSNDLSIHDDFQKIADAINKADKQLKENEDFKEKWISGIAHDIKTPLSVIISNTSLAMEKETDSDILRHMDPVLVESYYIQNLLNDLNIFTRLKNYTFELHKEEIKIVPFFKEIVIQIINQGIWDKFEFEFDYDSTLNEQTMFVEKNLISRVIHNLIYNSVLHNPEGCKISINLHRQADAFQIIISDNGVGISKEKMTEIYSNEQMEFDLAGVRRYGMGLRISLHIIQVHGGQMHIESELNQYFRTIIELPLVDFIS